MTVDFWHTELLIVCIKNFSIIGGCYCADFQEPSVYDTTAILSEMEAK